MKVYVITTVWTGEGVITEGITLTRKKAQEVINSIKRLKKYDAQIDEWEVTE